MGVIAVEDPANEAHAQAYCGCKGQVSTSPTQSLNQGVKSQRRDDEPEGDKKARYTGGETSATVEPLSDHRAWYEGKEALSKKSDAQEA